MYTYQSGSKVKSILTSNTMYKEENHLQNCLNCSSSSHCLPALFLNLHEGSHSIDITEKKRVFQPHQYIIHKGDPVRYLYAVHSGCCKGYFVDDKGREHISNFYYPSDIIGLESFFSPYTLINIVAIETSDICYIDVAKIEELSREYSSIRRQILNIFSKQLWQAYSTRGSYTAQELVVQFLLRVSGSLHFSGQSGTEFRLPMGRQDIGNFLGLSSETISRVFTLLKNKAVIRVERNNIKLCNLVKLHQLASSELK